MNCRIGVIALQIAVSHAWVNNTGHISHMSALRLICLGSILRTGSAGLRQEVACSCLPRFHWRKQLQQTKLPSRFLSSSPIFKTANMSYSVEERGSPNSLEYRMFFSKFYFTSLNLGWISVHVVWSSVSDCIVACRAEKYKHSIYSKRQKTNKKVLFYFYAKKVKPWFK